MKADKTVLLALTDAHHGFFKGVARYAREHRWHLVTDMIYTAKIPIGWRGDGVISFIGYRDDLAEFLLSIGVPVVEISMVRNDISLPRVEGDNEMIGRLAAEHFLERRFRHYAWAPLMDDTVNGERYRGFANRLAREKFTCHILPPADLPGMAGGTVNWTRRRKLLIRDLKRLPKPLAVLGYNDCVAADILNACEESRLLVPESVAVLGVDNDTILCECLRVPLSSVCHDLEGMAYRAAALLDRLMRGGKAPAEVIRIRPKGLVTRRSTDIVAVDNLPVARALRYIADQFANPLLGVDDIVTASGLSRRQIEKAFRHDLNRTISEEILLVRLKKVQDLLATTFLKVNEISALTGFSRPNNLYRCFQHSFGLTPKEYRGKFTRA
jgi:LacI family transcriptional regulator